MSFFDELKRRNVFRVAIAYVLLGWAVLQGADFLLDLAGAPEWVIRVFAIAGLVGFPFALFFAWAYELTPEGIKRESEVQRSQSITARTGRKLNGVIIGLLALVIVLMVVERFFFAGNNEQRVADQPQSTPEQTAIQSIAVLPFRDMSAARDQAYFGEGVAEELLNALVRLDNLKVASRTSSFAISQENLDIPAIAARLGVDHILEGSVRTSGQQVRITAQLIDVREDAHLWSQTYDGTLDDIFEFQDEITARIVAALHVQLSGQAVAPAAEVLTTNPEAYRLYLQGRNLWRQRSYESLHEAERLLQEAVELDPGFHQAWASLALVYFVIAQYDFSLDDRETLPKGLEAAERALAIDPANTEALLGKASYLEYNCRLAEAVTVYEQVIAANPDEATPRHWLAIVLNSVGLTQRARQEVELAIDLDPLITSAIVVQSDIEGVLGNYEQARALARKGTMMGISGGEHSEGLLALAQGDIEAARRLLANAMPGERDSDGRTEQLRLFFAALDDPAQLPRFHTFIGKAGDYVSYSEVDTMSLLAGTGDPYLFDYLSETACPPILYGAIWYESFREQRGRPEFLELMERAGVVELWQQHGWPDDCASVYGCPNH